MDFATGQQAFAQALLQANAPLPPGLTGAGGSADPARFAVYRNNVHVGLTRALAQRFGVTERLVGAEFFAGMARAYAQDRKPPSPLILAYGDDFPDFIAGFAPARELAYLPDVARLEAAWTRAYHAADAAPLTLAGLATFAPERLAGLALLTHPSAALLRSPHPVGAIWAAHQGTELAGIETWEPEAVLVVRPDMEVNVHILPARDGLFAARLMAGDTLGAAAQAALAEEPAFDVGAALVGLLSLGAFADIHHGDMP